MIALTGWLIALGIALLACRFEGVRRYLKFMTLGGLLAGLACSPFARSLIVSAGTEATVHPAGPEQAFVSVWLLVLLPVLRQRLDRAVLIGSLQHGLAALAATVMIVDIVGLGESYPPSLAAFGRDLVTICLIGGVFFIGFSFCLIMTESEFPWDYPAWFAGWMMVVQPVRDALLSLPLTAYEGTVSLVIAYMAGCFLYRPAMSWES